MFWAEVPESGKKKRSPFARGALRTPAELLRQFVEVLLDRDEQQGAAENSE